MSQCVLHVVSSLVPQAGTLGIVLPGLFRALRAAGWNSTAAVVDGACHVEADCPVHPAQETNVGALVKQADLVHIHGGSEPVARSFVKAARRQGKPCILAPHGAHSISPLTRRSLADRIFGARANKAMLRSAARVQAMNELEASELAGLVPGIQIDVLPYGFDCAAGPEPASIDNGTRAQGNNLIMLGPIEPAEGAVVVLKALAEVGRVADGWHIVIAGPNRGDYRAMLEAGIHRKGGEQRVRFASASDAMEQRGLLADASLLVAAGLRIGPPASIMLAVSMGVPVLATDCLAPDDLAAHLFVCRPNRAELRARLREVVELDAKKRGERAAGAIECLRTRLDWRVLCPRYADCYDEVLQATHR